MQNNHQGVPGYGDSAGLPRACASGLCVPEVPSLARSNMRTETPSTTSYTLYLHHGGRGEEGEHTRKSGVRITIKKEKQKKKFM